MAQATDLLTLFERHVERLTVDDWKRVYDAKPLGYGSGDFIPLISRDHYSRRTEAPSDAKDRLTALLEERLGDAKAAQARGDGRVQFLSHCIDRLGSAVDAIGNRKVLGPDGFVAGFGAFLPVIAPSAVGIVDEIAELWDPRVRAPLLERYAALLRSLHGRETAADALLPDDGERISLAICLESVGAPDARRAELEEMYVALCAFPSVSGSPQKDNADPVRACENARLKWLGYAEARLPDGERLTIGAGTVRAVAKEDRKEDELMTLMGCFGGSLPLGAVVIAVFVVTGGRLDLWGWIGAAAAGMSGMVVGMIVYSALRARTRFGSVERGLALAVSVALLIAVSAACGYLYIRFLTR